MPQDHVSFLQAIQVQTALATPMLKSACAASRQPIVCRTVYAFSHMVIRVLMRTSATLEDPARITYGNLAFVLSFALLVGTSHSPGFLIACTPSGKTYTS